MCPDIHCSTIYNSQDMEATKMSTNRGMNKEYVLHIYIERCIYKKDIKAIKAIKR